MLRTMCASYYMSEGAGTSCTDANLRIGTGADWVPSACRTTHYFNYAASGNTNGVVVTATRCTAGGKTPQGDGTTLTLSSNFTSGDTWGGTGSY
jgi:hypothetical protein